MMAYATVQELKDGVQIASSIRDTVLEDLLSAAENLINQFCNRPDGFLADTVASARYYVSEGGAWLRIDECVEVTAVAVKDSPSDDEDSYTSWTVGTIGTTTDADVFPARGRGKRPVYNRTPYNLLVIGANSNYSVFPSSFFTTRRGFPSGEIRARGLPIAMVTAKWGYASTVPPQVNQATIMQASRWSQRLKSSMADTTAGPEFGVMMFRKVLDPDIRAILVNGRLVKPAIGGGP